LADYPTYDDGWELSDVDIVGRDLEWLADVAGVPKAEPALEALSRVKKRLEFLERQYTGQQELWKADEDLVLPEPKVTEIGAVEVVQIDPKEMLR